ncbi:UNVERIFIED_CONTAM: hypothetical protein HDU68_007246 [Siphonaria sp. JEL0065]|nr:hypothetical protein HDU68_007246 [Siphonaria sp. JEL0065]
MDSKLHLDFYVMAVMLQIYNFLHNPTTKIPSHLMESTELLIAVTHKVPRHYREALISLGARLLILPILIKGGEKDTRYEGQYTKLSLWRLENVFETILYLDGDIFYLHECPIPFLWDFYDSRQIVNKKLNPKHDFFASTKDWARDYPLFGVINAGFLFFKPRVAHYKGLMKRAETPGYNRYVEQQLIGRYFAQDMPQRQWYTPIPPKYNVMHVLEQSLEDRKAAIGLHYKAWDADRETGGMIYRFNDWARAMQGLRLYQLDQMGIPKKWQDRKPVVPPVPEDYNLWSKIKDSREMFSSVAMVSLSHTDEVVLESRSGYLGMHAQQGFHYVLTTSTRHPNSNLTQAFDTVADVLKVHDWVWYAHELIMFADFSLPLHALLGIVSENQKPITIFKWECFYGAPWVALEGGASFMIRRSHAPQFNQFLYRVKELARYRQRNQRKEGGIGGGYWLEDSDLWQEFLKEFEGEYEVESRRDIEGFPESECILDYL